MKIGGPRSGLQSLSRLGAFWFWFPEHDFSPTHLSITFVRSDGKVQIDSPFSRLLGKPPVMVVGMMLLTVKAGFVSVILSAGYHIELASGGRYHSVEVMVYQYDKLFGYGCWMTSIPTINYIFIFCCIFWGYCNV